MNMPGYMTAGQDWLGWRINNGLFCIKVRNAPKDSSYPIENESILSSLKYPNSSVKNTQVLGVEEYPFFIVTQAISNSYLVRYVPLCKITQ